MRPELKHKISRIVTRSLWVMSMMGFLILFVASMKVKNNQRCLGLTIDIKNNQDLAFVKKSDITHLFLLNPKLNPVGKPIHSIDPIAIKQMIKKNPWIGEVMVYLDNNRQMHLDITQRKPLARVFTLSGASFYIDQKGKGIPVTDRFSIALPVFTNWPMDGPAAGGPDSVLFSQILDMSQFLNQDSFWNAQIVQINITPNGEFELIPRLGNQIIEFGPGDHLRNKFDRLFSFYKNGLPTLGWEKYSIINVKFNNEVVCTKKVTGKSPGSLSFKGILKDSTQVPSIQPKPLPVLMVKKPEQPLANLVIRTSVKLIKKKNQVIVRASMPSSPFIQPVTQQPIKQIKPTTKNNPKT
ncbi:MAG: cell division protein FtsQ/DivIB [Chitinophagaceae bacterium]